MKALSHVCKTCLVCDNAFQAKRSTAKYCSQACKDSRTNAKRSVRNLASTRLRPRGRTPRIKYNTIAPLLRAMGEAIDFEFVEHKDGMRSVSVKDVHSHWFDDYVMGACYVSMNEDRGRLDMSPGDIRKICRLDKISVKGVQSIIWNHEISPVSERHAQRLVKAAIIAVNGMEIFLDHNPSIRRKLTALVNAKAGEAECESAKIEREFLAEWDRIKTNA